nr:zinc finger, CCHC-type [Tanacetum cinerariifolium]
MSFEEAIGRLTAYEERIKSQDTLDANDQDKLLKASSNNKTYEKWRDKDFNKEGKDSMKWKNNPNARRASKEEIACDFLLQNLQQMQETSPSSSQETTLDQILAIRTYKVSISISRNRDPSSQISYNFDALVSSNTSHLCNKDHQDSLPIHPKTNHTIYYHHHHLFASTRPRATPYSSHFPSRSSWFLYSLVVPPPFDDFPLFVSGVGGDYDRAASSRDRPPMLATRRYPQWRSRFLRYIDTRPNSEALRKCIFSGPYKPTIVLVQAVAATDDSLAIHEHTTVETPMNMSPENKAHFESENEAIHLILTGIGDEIYSTVDACQTA